MRNELFHTHTYLFIHVAGDAQGRRRHDDLQHRDQLPAACVTTARGPTANGDLESASLFGCVAVPHVGDLESIGDDVGDLESIGDDVGDLESIGDDYKRPSTSRRTSAILLFHSIIYFVP